MNRFSTLRVKFLLGILPMVVIVAVLFSGIFALQTHQKMRAALATKQRVLPEVYSRALAALSSDFGPAAVGRVIGSLTVDPDVARATVLDMDDLMLAQIKMANLDESERQVAVEHMIVDERKPEGLGTKGKLRVVFHERALNKAIVDGVVRDASLILFLAAAIVLAAVITNRIIIGRPLERFLHAIRRADEEHVREPVAWSSRDEIGRVILAYNEMLAKLDADEAALRDRTDELTRSVAELRALGDVVQAVNSSLDLQQVLITIVTRAVELSRAKEGTIYELDEANGIFEPRANFGVSDAMIAALRESRIRTGDTAVGRCAEERIPKQVTDVERNTDYRLRDLLLREGIGSVLAVPLLREDKVVGALVIRRTETGEFPQPVVALLQTLAAQSVLAIQNARLFKEIQDKSEQLEVASRHKSQFLANMSHELRTPLNAVIGFSEVLQQRMFGELNDKQVEYTNYIHSSGSHLLSLINDILDLSKVEAGRMELDITSFNVPMAIDNGLTLVRERATRHGLALDCTLDPAVAEINADERKFKQVILNLLSNAVKFTPEGGRITVAARAINDAVEVSVSDTGIGIAPEDCDAVFEEFRQVGQSSDTKAQGTGLGLALTRKFIELHGGRIWLTSTLGKGSTFAFTLPVAQPAQALAQTAPTN